MIVYAAIPALPVGNWAGKTLHAIHGGGTFCKEIGKKNRKNTGELVTVSQNGFLFGKQVRSPKLFT